MRRLPGATGVIDIAGFLQTLREIGYDGPVTPEPFEKRLAAPAPLSIGRQAWQLGPLTLAAETLDWRTTLSAQADAARLQLHGEVSGSRIGRITGELAAAMAGPYTLAQQRPWHGQLEGPVNDLG